jgi:mycothiol system anti-sigma-R factor
MGDCNETLAELDRFLDGELSPQARSHIDAHLSGCNDCLQAFDFQAELKAAIRRKCDHEELPPGLLSKIQQLMPGIGDDLGR